MYTLHPPTTQRAKHDDFAKSRNTCPSTGWAEGTAGGSHHVSRLILSRVRGQIIHTMGKSIGVSSDPFSSLSGGNQKTGDVAGIQADPSRPNTPRPLRCVAGCSPTTTKLTITPTPIEMADGSRETKALEGLKWGTYNHPFSPQQHHAVSAPSRSRITCSLIQRLSAEPTNVCVLA